MLVLVKYLIVHCLKSRRWSDETFYRNLDFIVSYFEYMECVHIKKLEEKRPIIVYKADNQGAEIKGRVVHKEKIGDLYTITIQNYGIFVVSQDNYEFLKIGDEVRL